MSLISLHEPFKCGFSHQRGSQIYFNHEWDLGHENFSLAGFGDRVGTWQKGGWALGVACSSHQQEREDYDHMEMNVKKQLA